MNNYPIILAHGIARFDFLVADFINNLGPLKPFIEVAADGLNYFKGIAGHLRNNGFDVYPSSVGFASGLPARAADLTGKVTNALRIKNAGKVHIIAHSMGGLDARYMIARLGMADNIASLTTIGTPHLGTSFADWGIANGGSGLVQDLKPVIDLDGFLSLSTPACRELNNSIEALEAANSVFYQTYSSSESFSRVFTPLKGAWEIINDREGDNDGLVPVSSQRWTSELKSPEGHRKQVLQHSFPVAADHLNEIGWYDLNHKDLTLNPLVFASTIMNFELGIKDIYLKIARETAAL